jgi:hypothetical protein
VVRLGLSTPEGEAESGRLDIDAAASERASHCLNRALERLRVNIQRPLPGQRDAIADAAIGLITASTEVKPMSASGFRQRRANEWIRGRRLPINLQSVSVMFYIVLGLSGVNAAVRQHGGS